MRYIGIYNRHDALFQLILKIYYLDNKKCSLMYIKRLSRKAWRENRKWEKNNQNRDFKSCLSARSHVNNKDRIGYEFTLFKMTFFYERKDYSLNFFKQESKMTY